MVLLKNNGILPLKMPKKIAVIGRSAKEAHYQGGGSSHINPTQLDNPFEELQKVAGDARLSYAEGYPKDESLDQALIDEACKMAVRLKSPCFIFAFLQPKSLKGMTGLTST